MRDMVVKVRCSFYLVGILLSCSCCMQAVVTAAERIVPARRSHRGSEAVQKLAAECKNSFGPCGSVAFSPVVTVPAMHVVRAAATPATM